MCVWVCVWVFVQSGCVLDMLHISVICLVCFVLLTLLLVRRLGPRVVANLGCVLCMVVCVDLIVRVKVFCIM